MDIDKQKEIQGYLTRAIPDIARKCNVMTGEVTAELKTMLQEGRL